MGSELEDCFCLAPALLLPYKILIFAGEAAEVEIERLNGRTYQGACTMGIVVDATRDNTIAEIPGCVVTRPVAMAVPFTLLLVGTMPMSML